ncbi:MAG: glutamine--tRNA ligase/YqeY domain fusion protein [Nitrospiraceae bacterium]|nr:glutamine--tRNA ligase/YqeY domain fusion protein [Nitrospira sp.]MCB9775976.1 glutamine--tRNA ligase/YqeY domain fusion protein [Nitrospiraceae bacterium]
MSSPDQHVSIDFIRAKVIADLENQTTGKRVHTRFPPEPNGHLHIGHAKSICLNFGIAREFGGLCNLRFDDTNPTKESMEYVSSIQEDVRWLGFDWEDRLFFASDYFEQLYQFAVRLIQTGHAYVDSLTAEEIRIFRGTLTEPGKDSPFRNRTIEENLALFTRMRSGEFEDGAHVLRAKIDMASPNINLRDPALYRIRHASHYRTGDDWCLYPTYDFAHPLSDSLEGITHSLCTLEFEDHRPLYDWLLRVCEVSSYPQQIEFARLNLGHTVMSKRKLHQLVEEKHVNGWGDPRLPTLKGLRRRGYTPEAIRNFCERVGVAKRDSVIEMALLEHAIREDLNRSAPRVMAVLHPLKVIIENYPDGQVEVLEAINNPEDLTQGKREIPFSRELFIEQDDFREDPPKKFFRLSPGQEVRLRYAYIIRCVGVEKDPETGKVTALRCTFDPETKSGGSQSSRKVKGTLHWVSAQHALPAEVRLYEALMTEPNPGSGSDPQDLHHLLNPHSLTVLSDCQVEPGLSGAPSGSRFQFERQGYFCLDPDSTQDRLVFNRTVPLRDTWAKIEKK